MTKEKDIIYLAALLHDIGKFYQRADSNGAGSSKLLSDKIKNLEPSISPLHWETKKYTHKHALWTAQFFENMQSHFTQYIKLDDGWSYDKLLRLSSAHHAPDPSNLSELIIQKADHYSSGIDRDKKGGTSWKDAEEEADTKWDSFKRTRMRSIFEGVSLKQPRPNQVTYNKKLPLMAISTSSDFFPIISGNNDDVDYVSLWEQFEIELKFIQNKNIKSFNDSLLFLLEKYTSRIPSSTQHLPDVSLFDHLKTTAAFANSLKAYIDDKKLTELPNASEKPFALVGGALSGIQKFIYGIVSKGAAKNLKGRSFYLQLVVDNVVQMILEELELQNGNVIYSSGGGFYIIAPNTTDLPSKLNSLEKKLAKSLFDYHGTELYLSLDYAEFGELEIFNQSQIGKNIGEVWKELGENLSKKKSKRFGTLFIDEFELFFEPQKVSPEKKKDTITGEELGKYIKYLDEEKNKQPVNEYTWKQIELGKQLKKAHYWILSKEKLTYFPQEIFWFEPLGLGLHNYLVNHQVLEKYEQQLKASADNVRVIHFNKGNFLNRLLKGTNNINGFAWYGGNDFAENENEEPKTFEELTGITLDGPNYKEESKRKTGPELSRLGVLRMDVDNLGAIFRRGLSRDRLSFSRYSTLSRSLDWFFKGYLNTIWNNSNQYKEYSQIIYSGGDDLFIVGKWDYLIKMAAEIQVEFKKWVCENSELTLSGGMASVGPRFPILKSAAYSETFEKAAKKHKFNEQEKNAFSFICYTPQHSTENLHSTDELLISLNWDHEYPYIRKLKEELSTLMKMNDGLSEGFSSAMYNLLQQSNMELNKDGRFYPKNHRVTWLTAYQFKRSSDGKKEIVKEFFRTWVTNIMTGKVQNETKLEHTKYHALQFLALAARWAALEERSKI